MSETADVDNPQAPQKEPSASRSVKVDIYNQSYNIRGDGDSQYITQLAEFVDRRMRDLAAATLTVDSLKVAILAALHIADELHQLKKRYEEMDTQLSKKTTDFSQLIDEILHAKSDEPEAAPTEEPTITELDQS